MRTLRSKLGNYTVQKNGLLHYENYDNHVVLGIYDDDSIFAGTDKLSMAVNKDTIDFLRKNKKPVLMEGDRLFNLKFLEASASIGYDVQVIVCVVNDSMEILDRYKKRGRMQSMTFIKGRNTKINNIIKQFPVKLLNTTQPVKPFNNKITYII